MLPAWLALSAAVRASAAVAREHGALGPPPRDAASIRCDDGAGGDDPKYDYFRMYALVCVLLFPVGITVTYVHPHIVPSQHAQIYPLDVDT